MNYHHIVWVVLTGAFLVVCGYWRLVVHEQTKEERDRQLLRQSANVPQGSEVEVDQAS